MPPKSISTKKGDRGETNLLYGDRVYKTDFRIEVAGACDEAVSFIGVAKAYCDEDWIYNDLMFIQERLFLVGAEIATDPKHKKDLKKHYNTLSKKDVEDIDKILLNVENSVHLDPMFVIPGNSIKSAHMDVARVKVREFERRLAYLTNLKNPNIMPFVNRTSDVLFLLAQYQDRNNFRFHFTYGRKKSQ